jgi:CRP/FNR family transcriptional regulator
MIFVNKYIDICRINELIPVFNYSGIVNLVRMSGNISADSCSGSLTEWKNFRTLSPGELDYVSQNRFEAVYKRGEIVIKQGSPASNALFLVTGLAKTYMEGPGGKNFIISIDKPGMMLTGQDSYVNSRNNFSVSALTELKACFISIDVIRHLVRVNGDFAEGLLQDICSRNYRWYERMINLNHKKMPGRLADTLLYFAAELYMADEFEMILSRQELGEMTNMARESVVRILGEFEEAGILKSETNRIRVLDRDKLMLISERG